MNCGHQKFWGILRALNVAKHSYRGINKTRTMCVGLWLSTLNYSDGMRKVYVYIKIDIDIYL